MRRLAAVAMLVAWVALPVCAQRHSGGGGFSARSAPSFHSTPSFHSAPAPRGGPAFRGPSARPMPGAQRFAGPSQFRPAMPYRGAQTYRAGVRAPYNYGRPTAGSADRYRDHDGHRFRRPYISPFAAHSAVIVSGFWPGYYGFPDWLDYDDSYDTSNGYDPGDGYDPGYGDQSGDWNPPQQPEPWPSYGPYAAQPYAPPAGQAQAALPVQQSVTLIFKDGRAAEHVRNYVLTPSMLYVGDSARHEIPLSQLDVAATEAANQEAGVDFHLPQQVN